jgi:hypothetical protein
MMISVLPFYTNMKQRLRWLYNLALAFGYDPKKMLNAFRGLPAYLAGLVTIRAHFASSERKFAFGNLYPCLDDRFADSGIAKGHYFYQDWLVANRIFINNPEIHVDVGSRVDGFVAHVAAFRTIYVLDIRPLATKLSNIKYLQADLMSKLDDNLVECCDSLSCLHALEHFGLGRYGDAIQYDGYIVGLNNLCQLLKRTGKFYFSVPIGPQRIEFNAHRIFSLEHLLHLFEGRLKIDKFSYIDDLGDLHMNVQLSAEGISNNFDCTYGCCIFEMTKI